MPGVEWFMDFRKITARDDQPIADLIRSNLIKYGLDIPGTAFFDKGLDHLSEYYNEPRRAYYVLTENNTVIGGVGYAAFDGLDACCELQKLYLRDDHKGQRIGYKMMHFLEEKAEEAGYRRIYLETHTNLKAAIHLYEKCGYREIERPETVVHSTMNKFFLKEMQRGMK